MCITDKGASLWPDSRLCGAGINAKGCEQKIPLTGHPVGLLLAGLVKGELLINAKSPEEALRIWEKEFIFPVARQISETDQWDDCYRTKKRLGGKCSQEMVW